MTDAVEKFLKPILKACEGKRYLFRGTTERCSEEGPKEINSILYRWAVKKEVKFYEKYSPFNIEEEILKKTKRHFADSASNIEILTDLQHSQGKTNLIDFSRNLYIALFFACDGKHKEKPGELIILDPAKIEEKLDVVYAELQSFSDPFLIEPANTQTSQKRVTFQNSVFIYPPSGYINKDLCEIIPVPANIKQPILDHLREVHNIYTDTIYNDLIGFIANEKNYETTSVLVFQGVASYNKNKYKEAIGYYDKAIELDPNNARIYNTRGVAKDKLGKHQEAIVDYNKVIELSPNNAEAYYNRGIAKNRLGEHQKAIVDCDKAIELNPNDADYYSNRGFAKGELRQYQEEIADYNKAIELDPNNAIAYNNRGNAKNNLGQYLEAIADCDKAIELDPNNVRTYNNRGFAKSNWGQHQEAIADYEKAIELKPNNADAYSGRGVVKGKLGQYQEAISDFSKAIELNPKYADTYYNRGVAKYKLGQHQEAIVDCDKAIELNPKYAEAYHNRSLAYQALGRNQEADEDFKMAAKLKSDEAS